MQIKWVKPALPLQPLQIILTEVRNRVRTLTGKEIELDIEPDYKVRQQQLLQLRPRDAG